MKQTTLGCDWCEAGRHGLRPYAVATLALTNGKPKASSPSLDLCARHVRQLTKQFRPVKQKRGPRGPYTVTKKERARRAAKFGPLWKKREEQMLAALKAAPQGLKGPELLMVAKMSKHYVYKVAARLMAAGKIKRVGTDGERQGFVLV